MKWAQKKTESCPPRFIAIFRTILSDRVEDKHRKKQENLQSQSFWIYVILCWKKIRHVKEDRCDKIRRRHGTKQDESHSSQKGTTSYRRDDAYPSTLMVFLCALFQIPPLPLCSQERRSFGAFLKVRSRHFLSRECSKPFLSFPDRLLSRSRTFAGLWGGPLALGSSFPIFSIWVLAVATAALDEPTLEVDTDEVIDPALASGKAWMGAFLTSSRVRAALTQEVDFC